MSEFSSLHIIDPFQNQELVIGKSKVEPPFLMQRVVRNSQVVDWNDLVSFPRAGGTNTLLWQVG